MEQQTGKYVLNRKDYKKSRKYNASQLPIEISNVILPKYVVYYKECYNYERKLWREFFKIESHPLQTKIITSSKSKKITIQQKLQEIQEHLSTLNQQLLFQENTDVSMDIILPKYISLNTKTQPNFLIYDKKTNSNRKTYKMNLPSNYDLSCCIKQFLEKVNNK